MRVLVTGASGFVGGAVVRQLACSGEYDVVAASRRHGVEAVAGEEVVRVGDLGAETDWRSALAGVDTVVHTAGRVHVMRETSPDALAEYRRAIVDGTVALARQAAGAGARRFVFLSSIKVNGEATVSGRPFTSDDVPRPADAYALAKHEAEQALWRESDHTGLEVVVLRPVLVYGPGVKGNFRVMMTWLRRGTPLPLGAIDNRRSLVALDNLVDLVVATLRHPAAAGRTFLASDGVDLSTPELLRRTGAALGKRARLIPVPASLLRRGARLLGRADVANRLCESLQVDIARTRELLDWVPPVGVDDALGRAARHFMEHDAG